MLSRKNRLAKKKEIELVFKNGRSSYGQTFGVKCLANKLTYNRFTIVVSNKVSKKAVVRNKIKRRLREVIKAELPRMVNGYDLIIIALPIAVEKTFQDFRQEICRTFLKLRLYNKNEN